MYLLDTNIIIGILREKQEILKKYKELSEKALPIYLTSYSLSEIYVGFHDQEFKKKYPKKLKIQINLFSKMVNKLQAQNRIISLSVEDSKTLGEIIHLLKVKGNPIPIIDSIIGAIAISQKLIVITTDQNHFKAIKDVKNELKIEFW